MSKITRRSYKRKKIVMGVALFGAIALVSTGFAAWVLSASAQNQQPANIKVGAVSDKSMAFQNVEVLGYVNDATELSLTSNYSFNPRFDDNSGRVRFGAKATPEQANNDEGERLSLVVRGEITEAQNLGSLKVSFDSIPAELEQAVTAEYIELPACANAPQDVNFTVTGEASKVASFEYEIAFQWGNAFGNENPGDYYEIGHAGASVETSVVKTTLEAMHELLDNCRFSVTFVADPN